MMLYMKVLTLFQCVKFLQILRYLHIKKHNENTAKGGGGGGGFFNVDQLIFFLVFPTKRL